ncbi:MAG TPA: amino acid adenylation domain-containing protein, partial [Thermoanaerobaculia bacterium]|nr:amino acid adenylation domain-containing protein [Thermoanaerobaculia bacterium]
ALPLTPNGKLDRAALPAPEGTTAAAGREDGSVAPRDPVEGLLAGIWEEVLGRERVGVTDDFFALGGHSLLATQVVSRVRETFGVELPVHDLFERPTIAGLSAALHPLLQGRAFLGDVPPILPVPRSPGDELPLSFSQQRLWFVEQLEPGTLVYNMPWAMRLTGALDPARLRRTLEEVVRRHEALRTTFHGSSRGPVSRVLESQPVPLPLISLEGLPESAAEAEVRRLGLAELLRPFDLERGPLLRAILLRLGAREHALIPVMHHIVSDGWSMGVLQREVALLYGAFSRGESSPLPDLPIQYADFAIWQREWMQDEVLAVQLAHWHDALAGAPLRLELPADRPRPVTPTHRGGALPARLSAGLTRELEAFSRREGVTPFMTLLASFGVLLGRLAHQEDVLVGSPIANRNRREIEELIGFFVNTLVLRVMMRGTPPPSFRELLGRVRQAALGAYTHQDLPFEQLVDELITEREGGYPPLVQTVFALQNAPAGELELPHLTLNPFVIENGLSRFDLTLVLNDSPSGFQGYVEYDAELFDRTTAERLLDRLTGLLESALAEPDREVGELELLLAGEREQLVRRWNDTASAYPREAGLPELFGQVARELPEEPAILARGEIWTYRRLDEESSRLALRLRSLGVGAETPVGIAMERSPELILGMLAILKAGGIYVPLDAGYPDERLAFMLEDTGARAVLVHAATRDRMAALRPPPRLELVAWGLPSPGEESRESRNGIGGDALAYVIYTSGSTGRPKGVAVTHRAIVRLVCETNYVHLGPGARLGHVANISFDAATYEIWGALLTGAAVVVIPRETVLDPQAFAATLCEQRVTSMFLTSSLFTRMAQEVPDAFQHMSELLVGGEAVDPAAARRVLARRPPRRLLNGYGPTESTTFAAWHPICEVPAGAAGIPIGLPLANTRIYVLDRWLRLVPPGSTGELCIGGDGLARGYWNRPEPTAERFVPHPWGDGERLYRTGDLARQRPDGTVEFLGRLDDQVKIRGFRIEPGEIEAVLAGHPAVRECAVLARQDGAAGERHLVGYVVLDPADPSDSTDPKPALSSWLRDKLPDYMVPAAWAVLEALPLTANGKLDRRALPAPLAGDAEDRGYVAPSGPIEEALAAIWAEVLRLERIGAHDDFFALGGHSLLATQVVTRVREVLGLELPLRRLFETPSLRELARSLGATPAEDAGAPILSRAAAPTDGGEPLSLGQQRLWFLDQLEPGNPAYNVPLAVRLTGDGGELSVEALERTLGEVVRRHAVLRTSFVAQAGQPVQVIAPPEAVRLELQGLDLSEVPDEVREDGARELALEEARSPFDLGHGPLLRSGLLRLAEREHLLLVTLHHIVSDGWSLGVLLREIEALYPAFLRGEPSPLPELPLQYADFARWQRSWLQGEVLERQLAYWKEKLAGAPTLLELPTDRPRPAVQTFRGATRAIHLSAALSERVRELGRLEGATPFMILLAAWAFLLGRHAGQEDLLLGTPIAGRNRREIEDLIGFFVNTLVLRIRPSSPSFRELLGQVRETVLEAFAHQELPFERLVEELLPERDLAVPPMVQAVFALQNTPTRPLSVPGLSLEPVAMDSGTAKLDLTLGLQEEAGVFAGALEHNTDLFDGSTAVRLLARFEALLEGAVADPRRPMADLSLLLPAERHQTLVEPNAAWDGAPPAARLLERFLERAAAAPEAPALIFAGTGEVLSYRELERRSALWARSLRGLGVGPEVRVGICVRRSPRMIVGLLAVLRAGGAYVPLDPAWPAERLAWMLDDAGVGLVLTEAATAERLPDGTARPLRRLFLDQPVSDAAHSSPAGLPLDLPDPAQPAYVIYTSGSTGRPKGVVAVHGGLAAFAEALAGVMALTPDDRVLQSASLSFDASAVAVWPTLLRGAAVVLHPDPAALSARELLALCAARELTVLELPAALWRLVVQEMDGAGLRFGPSVRLFMTGGESLSPEILRQWGRTVAPEARLVSSYGPTEATVAATVFQADGLEAVGSTLAGAPLGKPLPGIGVYLLDARLSPVLLDVPGEIFLGGAGVTRGYLGRPDLTAAVFLPDPWGPPGARLYRTGDRARRRPHHETKLGLEFLGRVDQQVKIRGFRVEPGEIEAVLGGHPAVREALVLARAWASGDLCLVAYLTLRDGLAAPAAELRSWMRQRLPEHLVPSAFVVLETFPLAPTGKVDRRALPAPERVRGSEKETAPGDPVEELLAGIWTEVLRLERVGVRDDFFALGGHSLLATQVISRLREVLGVDLPLRTLFEKPTIGALAEAVRQARQEGAPPAPPIVPAARSGLAPLSFAQQRLWLIDRLEPGNPAYNTPLAVRLSGELRPALLERIFAEIIRRHEALRTIFALRDEEPVQVIATASRCELPLADLSHLSAAASEAEARALALAEARRSFDLQKGPLLRLLLVRRAATEHLLLVSLHHIVTDGWSMGVLLREVGALYEAFAHGRPSLLPELPVQYADFAVWQREWLRGGILAAQLDFWKRELAGAPTVLGLPLDRPRLAARTSRGASRPIALDPVLSDAVRELCRRQGVTPFMALLAAWAVLLGRHAGQDDVLLGSPAAGRTRREIEELIGFFVNTLVLRVVLRGTPRPSFRELLGRVRETALGAFAHQDLPFERLVEELVTERGGGYPPLIQVMLTLQNAPLAPLELPGLTVCPLALEGGAAKLDLTLLFEDTPAGLAGWLEYDAALFDRSTAQRLLARFAGLLESAVAEPDRELAELGLLPASERAQLVLEWNDGASAFPRETGLGELFAEWARSQPQAPAVVEAGETWSYGRLEAEANRLAWHLRSLGVEREARVGVAMERSAELVLALLAVLKAGGVYVPLDPGYPDERLRFLLADAGAAVVLVHGRTRQRLAGVEPEPPWRLVSVATDRDATAPWPAAAPPHQAHAEELAYLLYTSGSTGRPKGSALPHRAVARLVRGTSYIALGPRDRLSMVTGIGFDPSIFEVWGALANGGAVVVIEREVALSPRRLAMRLREEGVTAMFLATALFHQVAREEPAAFRSLRHLLVAGEVMDPVAAARVLAAGPPERLLNAYGPTESTTFATWAEIREVAAGALSVPIGRPLSNTTAYVVEAGGELAALGQVGELWLGGEGLARGYVNRPELTAEKFVPDPWSGAPGGRLYRTGDLARRRWDGVLDYLGRIDHQVKIRGFRVEPEEVEAVLAGCPGVEGCAVVARRAPGRDPAGQAGEVRLVAYVVAAPGPELREAAVRDYLRQSLPDSMVPAAYLFLQSLPLTPNGKLDREALPAPAGTQHGEGGYVGPRDALELALVKIWEEILEPRPIGVRDDFFELGGHSLLAVQLMARIERRLGALLPEATLLRRRTIEGLAAAIGEQAGPVRHAALVEIEPGNGRPFFCIHPIGGDVLCYVPLARRLVGDRSVWGLQVPDLAAGRALATVE